MLIKFNAFGGIAPKVSPRLLSEINGQTAENCKLTTGGIVPLKNVSSVVTPSKVGNKLSIYPYDLANNIWLHWLTDVDVCRSPVANDSYGRVYWTGDDLGGTEELPRAKYGVAGNISSGGSEYPQNYYHLGIPKPAAAPTIIPESYSSSSTYALGHVIYNNGFYSCTTAITTPEPWTGGHWSALDSAAIQLRAYVYTYVSEYGEEGQPSDPSTITNVGEGQIVAISNMSTAPVGGAYNITKKRIYRTNTGTSGTEYQLVHEIDIANTTDSESVASASLGEVCPSDGWIVPPPGLSGIINLPNGCLAGFIGNQICLSVPYQPHAWPLAYRWCVDFNIVAIGAYGASIAILTQGNPFTLTGGDPETMGSPERLEDGHACLCKRGVVDLGSVIAYPSPIGLMGIGMGGVALLTEKVLDGDSFSSFTPVFAVQEAGKYVAFTSYGGWVFNPRTNDLTTHSITALCGYCDQLTGDLYLYVNSPASTGPIAKFDSGSNLTSLWESKDITFNSPVSMGVAQVYADAYPITLMVYRDGSLISTLTISSDDPVRLPLIRGVRWKVKVQSAVTVHAIFLAGEMEDIFNG